MHDLELELHRSWAPSDWSDVTVLAGVSGGPDSVAMLWALLRLKAPGEGRIVAAHYNHGLRGEHSADDAAMVTDLCRELGIACIHGSAAPRSEIAGVAEEQTRRERYAFFREAAGTCGARYVATAHTADDQAETILHRILRGSGLAGIAGIPRVRRLGQDLTVVRPLLTVRRRQILDYLAALGQSYRHDASNQDLAYTRNRLRHELLPHLAEHYNPRVIEALLRLGRSAAEAHELLASRAAELLERVVVHSTAKELCINCGPLSEEHPSVVREMFVLLWRLQDWPRQAMTSAHWRQLAVLARSDSEQPLRQFVLPGNILAKKTGEQLSLTRLG
jgi:tRNA(Ile)-lysidine synthase